MEKIVLGAILDGTKILVGKLKKKAKTEFGGVPFVMPGGRIKSGENEEHAIIRKVKEEAGLNITIIKKIGVRTHPLVKKKLIYFHCVAKNSTRIKDIKHKEIEKFLWIDIERVYLYMMTLYTKVYAAVLHYLANSTKLPEYILLSLPLYDQNINFFSKKLLKGELVAFPTETVYGIGANAYDPKAVARIFEIKRRPQINPLIVHISSIYDLKNVARKASILAYKLIENFWPGPLTIVLQKNKLIPDIVTGGLNTVAIRNPNNAFALELLSQANVPIAAPSANISGRPSATHHKYIIETFGKKLPNVIKGGSSSIGLESTVVNLTSPFPQILRLGGLPKEKIEKVIGEIKVYIHKPNDKKPLSPGMMFRHYAPKAKLELIKCNKNMLNNIKKRINFYKKRKYRIGVLCINEFSDKIPSDIIVYKIGSIKNLNKIAKSIFKALIELDKQKVDVIISQSFPEKMIGRAIMDRLRRASSV
jgi:L-threonylcarbamoyladenylate synthase